MKKSECKHQWQETIWEGLSRTLLDQPNPKVEQAVKHVEKIRFDRAKALLAEALDRMMSGQPPPYGRTWTTCLKIKHYLKDNP